MKRALVSATLALALVASAAACSRDRDPGSGIGDLKNAAVPQAATPPPSVHNHSGMPMPESGTANEGANTTGSREIVLTSEMIQRAGIQLVEARKGTATTRLHLPGVVQPNAYKNVDVTSLVTGRITQVRAELGQPVMLNEMLATVYSPELADAQTAFIQAKAARDAHGLALTRTQRLYAIGAVSREELEKMTAEATEMDRAQEVARSRLVDRK